ncbi:putative glycosyl transferase [Providencia rustigianii]|uniref:Putative glycosyl transferase n=1 Tax=Providencia rustigianii TaxID=158850 RepID=A0A379G8F7_9GAMM|nr:glycosyltransferase [Providencia rustigianii]SUC37298.1 putative glycosyl transferase [Providencia rustigianii]
MKKISICVICYNQEDYIIQCISSILNQKGNFHLELVIRDDCSTDNTFLVCQNYIKKIEKNDVSIKLLDSSINLGPNRNTMEVLKNCTGDFIAFCEGDDYWVCDTKLQQQLECADKYPNIDFFVHPAFYHYPNGKLEKKAWPILNQEIVNQSKILAAKWQFAPTSSYFIRSNIIKNLPLWFSDATIGDIYIEIYSAKNNIFVLNRYLSAYRYLSKNSWSLTFKSNAPEILAKKINHYNNFINCLEKIKIDFPNIENEINTKIKNLKIQLSKIYFFSGDKKKSKEIAEDLFNQNLNFTPREYIILKILKSPLILGFLLSIKNR